VELPIDGIPKSALHFHPTGKAAYFADEEENMPIHANYFPRQCTDHDDCDCAEAGLAHLLIAACRNGSEPALARVGLTWQHVVKELWSDTTLYDSPTPWHRVPFDDPNDGFFLWYPDCACCDATNVRWNGSPGQTRRLEGLTAPFLNRAGGLTAVEAVRLYKLVERAPLDHVGPRDQDRVSKPLICARIAYAHFDKARENNYMKVHYTVEGDHVFVVYIHEQLFNGGTACAYIRTRYYSRTARVFRVMAGIDYLFPTYDADGTFKGLLQLGSLLYDDEVTTPATAMRESLAGNRTIAEKQRR
jgi:hypothetical protein